VRRQGDALAVYNTLRRTLVDELGVEPGFELQRLQVSSLRHGRTQAGDRHLKFHETRDNLRRGRVAAPV
jgi:hypothetical protein